MKRLFGFAFVLALISVPAFAAKNSQSVTVPENVTVGSAQLPAGDYKVSWTGTGNSVQVTLKQQGVHTPATATVPAKLVEENHDQQSLIINSQSGARTLDSIQLKHVSLVLTSGPASGQ
jgi:hypothetical protein